MFNILYLSSIILGSIGAWAVASLGSRFSLLDISNHRSSHDGVVPKGGGIGLLAAFLLASAALGLPPLFWIFIGSISLFSLYGDRKEISAKGRLCMQFAAGFGLLLGLFVCEDRSYWIYLLIPFLTVFVVGTANCYNFMDGIDGIAGITGIIGFGLLAAFNVLSGGDSRFSVLSICIALSCLGFLPFNMPKAKVFMGDVGSILLGFVFAAIVVMLSKTFLDFVCLAGFLFPFYADELTTMAIRIKDDENLLKPHRRHLYQVLANEMGVAHWKVSVGYGILQLVVGLSILSARPFGILSVLILLVIYFIGFVWANYVVRAKISRSF